MWNQRTKHKDGCITNARTQWEKGSQELEITGNLVPEDEYWDTNWPKEGERTGASY